jgi:hypothetical protein
MTWDHKILFYYFSSSCELLEISNEEEVVVQFFLERFSM